jgi:1-aminocyclopropane-1-carboxylate deaminase
MFFGIYDLIRNNFFPLQSTIAAIHTGGLQGLQGLKQRGKI